MEQLEGDVGRVLGWAERACRLIWVGLGSVGMLSTAENRGISPAHTLTGVGRVYKGSYGGF